MVYTSHFGRELTFATNKTESGILTKERRAVHFFFHLRPVCTQKSYSVMVCICEIISDSEENEVGFLIFPNSFLSMGGHCTKEQPRKVPKCKNIEILVVIC